MKEFILIVLVSVGMYFTHLFFLEETSVFFSLEKLYLFHGISTSVILFLLTEVFKHLKEQIGLVFLFLVTIKLFLLVAIFKGFILGDVSQSMSEKMSFSFPFLVFLVLELGIAMNLLKRV